MYCNTSHSVTTAQHPPPAMQHFFELLYPGVGDGWLVLSWPSPTRTHKDGRPTLDSAWHNLATTTLAEIAADTQAHSTDHSVYFGLVVQHPSRTPDQYVRSRNDSAYIMPGLYFDLDLATGAHAASSLPATETEALAFLHALPAKPSLVVRTGGGFHGYWVFESPIWLQTAADRLDMAHLQHQFAHTLCQAGKERGWALDALRDLARALRPPGTINYKYDTPVELIAERPVRYDVPDFDWLMPLPEKAASKRHQAPGGPQAPHTDLQSKPDLVMVVEALGCPLTRKSQAEWHGTHPQHGSSTGVNLDVDPAEQLWHCWRHDSGGDVFDLIAICEGLLACEDCHHDHPKGYRFPQVLDIARARFGWQPPTTTRSPFRPLATHLPRGLRTALRRSL